MYTAEPGFRPLHNRVSAGTGTSTRSPGGRLPMSFCSTRESLRFGPVARAAAIVEKHADVERRQVEQSAEQCVREVGVAAILARLPHVYAQHPPHWLPKRMETSARRSWSPRCRAHEAEEVTRARSIPRTGDERAPA